jgi:glycosyltransferase involved in cell wall biosynthesis
MKILHVCHSFYPCFGAGGVVRVTYELSKKLVERGHEITVYTTDGCQQRLKVKTDCPVDVQGVRAYYFRNLSNWLRVKMKIAIPPYFPIIIKNEIQNFDIIHIHECRTTLSILAHYYAEKYGVPYVLQAHGSLPRHYGKEELKWLYDVLFGYRLLRDAAKVVALSRVEAEQYRRMGVPEEKIAIIPNGIDLSEYTNLPPRGCFKRKFGIKEEEKIVLYLGRIHRIKGIDFLIKSFAYLVKNGIENVRLVIAGPDDGYLYEARSLVSLLGVSSKVLFTGTLNERDKVSAFVDSSLVVSPERFNVFLLVPLEAAACGKPVIVSSTNYISSMIRKDGFGFSVKYGDITELAETMGKMLTDTNLSRRMGEKGRKYVFENCDWAHVVAKLEKVYKEISGD